MIYKLNRIRGLIAVILTILYLIDRIIWFVQLEWTKVNGKWHIELPGELSSYYISYWKVILTVGVLFLILGCLTRFFGERTLTGEKIQLIHIAYLIAWICTYEGFAFFFWHHHHISGVVIIGAALFIAYKSYRDIGLMNFKPLLKIKVNRNEMLCYLGFGVALVVSSYIPALFSIDMASWREEAISQDLYSNYWLAFLTVVIIGPISEELMYRGIIQTALTRRLGVNYAVLLTALLFAIGHVDIVSLLPIFIIGLWLSWARAYYDSLWVPITIHMFLNFFSTVYRI